jgi:2-phosphoglycerate kinase
MRPDVSPAIRWSLGDAPQELPYVVVKHVEPTDRPTPGWEEGLQQSTETPLIVLIGGSTGTGKSTVAVEVARCLGITRVASTDIIRQTMRAFFSPQFMPTIHYSSFEAGEGVGGASAGDPTIAGFVDQCQHVCVGVEAAIRRAIAEGWSMVLEGVHVVPGLLPVEFDDATVVQVVVEVRDVELHRENFHMRDAATKGTRGKNKYLARLDEIRRIQEHIAIEARAHGVAVVDNINVDRTITTLVELVRQAAPGHPALSPKG